MPPAAGVLPLLTARGGFGNGWMAADRLMDESSGSSTGLSPSCDQLAENRWQCVDQVSGHQPGMTGGIGGPAVEPGAGGGRPGGREAHGGQGSADAGEDITRPRRGP